MLLCVTANHRNADFDLLNSLAANAETTAAALLDNAPFIAGAIVLATCNRFEVYLDVDEPLAAGSALAWEATIEAVSRATGVRLDELRDAVAVLGGEDAARHLFAVSSGLESVVLGEDEISGQVRRALATARESGTTSGLLEQLFQRATRTSRGVKATTAIGGVGRSMTRLALDLASTRVADWAVARTLVIGTGRLAAATVTALRERGTVDVRVFSSTGRAQAFAGRHGLRLVVDLAAAVADADVVIACSTGLVLTADHVGGDRDRPCLVIDLGLPRNVDRSVGDHPGIDLLDLELLRVHAPIDDLTGAESARALVHSAATDFVTTAAVEPAVVAMRRHVLAILEDELARSRARGEGPGTENALRHFASVLLHGPSAGARRLALDGRADDFSRAVETVFGLRIEPAVGADGERHAG